MPGEGWVVTHHEATSCSHYSQGGLKWSSSRPEDTLPLGAFQSRVSLGPCIELARHLVEARLVMLAEVGTLGEVLPE